SRAVDAPKDYSAPRRALTTTDSPFSAGISASKSLRRCSGFETRCARRRGSAWLFPGPSAPLLHPWRHGMAAARDQRVPAPEPHAHSRNDPMSRDRLRSNAQVRAAGVDPSLALIVSGLVGSAIVLL